MKYLIAAEAKTRRRLVPVRFGLKEVCLSVPCPGDKEAQLKHRHIFMQQGIKLRYFTALRVFRDNI